MFIFTVDSFLNDISRTSGEFTPEQRLLLPLAGHTAHNSWNHFSSQEHDKTSDFYFGFLTEMMPLRVKTPAVMSLMGAWPGIALLMLT